MNDIDISIMYKTATDQFPKLTIKSYGRAYCATTIKSCSCTLSLHLKEWCKAIIIQVIQMLPYPAHIRKIYKYGVACMYTSVYLHVHTS